MASESRALVLRGHRVETDLYGNCKLDDLWELAKATPSRMPRHWRGNSAAKALIAEVQKKVTAANIKDKSFCRTAIYAKAGRGNAGTFAHPVLAVAYAGYLSPKLEVEIREVWLRYRAGDARLADEILDRASAEDNEWAGARALGRAERKRYTEVLKQHGVAGIGFAMCTNATYETLFDRTAGQLKVAKRLEKKANLRDHMDTTELALTMISEQLAGERIQDEDRRGNYECRDATVISAARLRQAVDADRADRRR